MTVDSDLRSHDDHEDEVSSDSLLFSFFNELGIINQLVSTFLERALPGDMRLAQFGVLNHFARLGGEQTPAELASAFQVTKGAMTNTLAKLQAKGYVRVRGNPSDGRSKLVTISASGRRARDKAIAALGPAFAEFGAEFPKAGIERALPVLRKVRAILDEARN